MVYYYYFNKIILFYIKSILLKFIFNDLKLICDSPMNSVGPFGQLDI